MESGVELEEVP